MFEEAHLFQTVKSEYMFECHTDCDVAYYLDHRNGVSWIQVIVEDDDAGVELEFCESAHARSF